MTTLMTTTTSLIADAPSQTELLFRTSEAPARQTESVDDLRGIVGERGLIKLALQSVERFGSDLPLWHVTTEPGYSSRMLLALLTYSYAAGVYASEDIHRSCKSDAGARYLSASTWPEERSLRRFRRKWRSRIESCLQWVCAVVESTQSLRLPDLEIPDAGKPGHHRQSAGQRIETALVMDMVAGD